MVEVAFKTPLRRLEDNRRWRKANPEKFAKYMRSYIERHPDRTMHRTAKNRAKRRGMEFTITYDDIKIPDTCPVLGIPIVAKVGCGHGGSMDSPSLDRIDNTRGYTPDNVQVISKLANTLKGAATPAQLRSFAAWVGKTYGH